MSVCIRSDGLAIKAQVYITSFQTFQLLILGLHRNIRSLSLPSISSLRHLIRLLHKNPKDSTHTHLIREANLV